MVAHPAHIGGRRVTNCLAVFGVIFDQSSPGIATVEGLIDCVTTTLEYLSFGKSHHNIFGGFGLRDECINSWTRAVFPFVANASRISLSPSTILSGLINSVFTRSLFQAGTCRRVFRHVHVRPSQCFGSNLDSIDFRTLNLACSSRARHHRCSSLRPRPRPLAWLKILAC